MKLLFSIMAMFIQPCGMEDDIMCYWDAANMGNGLGYSYVMLNDDAPIYILTAEQFDALAR